MEIIIAIIGMILRSILPAYLQFREEQNAKVVEIVNNPLLADKFFGGERL